MSTGPILNSLLGEQAALAADTLAGQAAMLAASGQGATAHNSGASSAHHQPAVVLTHAAGPLASREAKQHPPLWRNSPKAKLPIQVIDRRVERGEIPAMTKPMFVQSHVAVSKTAAVARTSETKTESVPAPVVRLATGAQTMTKPVRNTRGFQAAVAAAGALLVALPAAAGDLHRGPRTVDLPWQLDLINWVQAYPNLSFGLVLLTGTAVATVGAAITVGLGVGLHRLVRGSARAEETPARPRALRTARTGVSLKSALHLVGTPFRALGRVPQAARVLFGQTTPLDKLLAGGMTVITGADIAQFLTAKMAVGIPTLTDTADLHELNSALDKIHTLNRARMIHNLNKNQLVNTNDATFVSKTLDEAQQAITAFFANLNESTLEKRKEDLQKIEHALDHITMDAATLGSQTGSDSNSEQQFYDAVAAFTKDDGPAGQALDRARNKYVPHHDFSEKSYADVFEGADFVGDRVFLTSLGNDVPFDNRVMSMDDLQTNGLGRASILPGGPHFGLPYPGQSFGIHYDRDRLRIVVTKEEDGSFSITNTVRGKIKFERVRNIPAADATPARLRQELHQAREYLRITLRTHGKVVDGALTMADSDPTIAFEPPFATYLASVNLGSGAIAIAGRLGGEIALNRPKLGGLPTVTYREPDLLTLRYGRGDQKSEITIKALPENKFRIYVRDPLGDDTPTSPRALDGDVLAGSLNHRLETLVLNAENAEDKRIAKDHKAIFSPLHKIKTQMEGIPDGSLERSQGGRYLGVIEKQARFLLNEGMTPRGVDEALRPFRELVNRKMAPLAPVAPPPVAPAPAAPVAAPAARAPVPVLRRGPAPTPAAPPVSRPMPDPAAISPSGPVVASSVAAQEPAAAVPVPAANKRTGTWDLLGEALADLRKFVGSFLPGSSPTNRNGAAQERRARRTIRRSSAVTQAPLPDVQPLSGHDLVKKLASNLVNGSALKTDKPVYATGSTTGEWAVELKDKHWITFDNNCRDQVTFQMNLYSPALLQFLRDNFGDMLQGGLNSRRQGLESRAYDRLMGLMLEKNVLTNDGSSFIPPGVYTIDHIFAHGYLREPRAAMFVLLAVYAYLGVDARTSEETTSDRQHHPVILLKTRSSEIVHVIDIPGNMGAYSGDPNYEPQATLSPNQPKDKYTGRASGSYLKTNENP